jgi:T5orf172 domain
LDYIYLLQEREFVNKKECVYKIGRTEQINLGRFKSYPKGSILYFQGFCVDSVRCEREILKLFQSKYEKRRDIGSEYFEGDINDMIFDLYSCAQTSLALSSEARLGNMNNKMYSCAQTSLMSSGEARLGNMSNNIQERANRLQNRQIQKDVLEMNQRNEKQTAAINFYRRIMFMYPLCTPMNLSPHNCVVYNLCIPNKNIAIVVPYTEKDSPYAPINNEDIKWIND